MTAYWYRDDRFPQDEWISQVQAGEVLQDYLAWVLAQYHDRQETPPPDLLEAIDPPTLYGLDEDGSAPVPDLYRQRYPREEWVRDVARYDTRAGYEGWLWSMVSGDRQWEEEQAARHQVQDQARRLDQDTAASVQASPRRTRM